MIQVYTVAAAKVSISPYLEVPMIPQFAPHSTVQCYNKKTWMQNNHKKIF